jgi:hypothetical protein
MAAGLRESAHWAWKLICYEGRPVDGSPSFYPMSEKPMGIIVPQMLDYSVVPIFPALMAQDNVVSLHRSVRGLLF